MEIIYPLVSDTFLLILLVSLVFVFETYITFET